MNAIFPTTRAQEREAVQSPPEGYDDFQLRKTICAELDEHGFEEARARIAFALLDEARRRGCHLII